MANYTPRDERLSQCRFCKLDGYAASHFPLVKYGVRHYAHADCLLDARGFAVLQDLSLHALETFPALATRTPEGQRLLGLAIKAGRLHSKWCMAGVPRTMQLLRNQRQRTLRLLQDGIRMADIEYMASKWGKQSTKRRG